MQEIPVEKARPNMKLACRIRNKGGEVIAECNEALSEKFLSQCNILGIYYIHVLGNPVPGAPASYNTKERLERIPELFKNHQDNMFMKTLESFLKKHLHERL